VQRFWPEQQEGKYKSLVQVLEHYKAAIGAAGSSLDYVDIVKATLGANNTPEQIQEKEVAFVRNHTIAMGFLKQANQRCFGGLWIKLENNYTRSKTITHKTLRRHTTSS
jgi:hypothetical protein